MEIAVEVHTVKPKPYLWFSGGDTVVWQGADVTLSWRRKTGSYEVVQIRYRPFPPNGQYEHP